MSGMPQIVYDAGKGLLRWWLDREREMVKVQRIRRPDDDSLQPALALCERLLPQNEVDSPADVARWLAEIEQETAEGRCRLVDYLLVSKIDQQVCGVLYGHYYPQYKLMFLSYMVSDDTIPKARDGKATQSLMKYLLKARDHELSDMEGIVFEMAYPKSTLREKNLRCRSRSRLFEFYAQQLDITVRVLNSPYQQPRLELGGKEYEEERQLLAYGRTCAPALSQSIPRSEAEHVLSFVYSGIYGDQFEGDPHQDRQYREYLDDMYRRVTQDLPLDVPLISASAV